MIAYDAVSDYLLWFAKNQEVVRYRQIFLRQDFSPITHSDYRSLELQDGTRRPMTSEERLGRIAIPNNARPYQSVSLHSQDRTDNTEIPVHINGMPYKCPPNRHWSNDPHVIEKAGKIGLVEVQGNTPRRVTFFDHTPGVSRSASLSRSARNKERSARSR